MYFSTFVLGIYVPSVHLYLCTYAKMPGYLNPNFGVLTFILMFFCDQNLWIWECLDTIILPFAFSNFDFFAICTYVPIVLLLLAFMCHSTFVLFINMPLRMTRHINTYFSTNLFAICTLFTLVSVSVNFQRKDQGRKLTKSLTIQ